MEPGQTHLSNRPLRTPRAAAIAGIIFAGFQIYSYYLLQTSIPSDPMDQNEWLTNRVEQITLALGLLPFAGIAFLWFIGVLRDRLGHLEDQFFSTLFLGSGLLYLAMSFASASIAGGLLAVVSIEPDIFTINEIWVFGRSIIFKFNNVYAIRMAGMFMFVLGTIWVKTGLMPRWMAILTYMVALSLIIAISFYPWTTLFFPLWVLLISAYILVLNFRYRQQFDGVTFKG